MAGWTAGAAKLWADFYDENVTLQEAETDGYLESVYSKLEGQAAKLALVIHMMRWTEDPSLSSTVIEAESMRMGIELTRWCRREIKRIYMISNQALKSDEEEKVLEFVANMEEASLRNIKRTPLRGMSSDQVNQIIDGLVKKGHLLEVTQQQEGKGRPTQSFRVS